MLGPARLLGGVTERFTTPGVTARSDPSILARLDGRGESRDVEASGIGMPSRRAADFVIRGTIEGVVVVAGTTPTRRGVAASEDLRPGSGLIGVMLARPEAFIAGCALVGSSSSSAMKLKDRCSFSGVVTEHEVALPDVSCSIGADCGNKSATLFVLLK